MEAAGLVRRNADPSDRRTALIDLTPAGRELAVEATNALNSELFESPGVPSNRVAQSLDLLKVILGRQQESSRDPR